MMTTRECAIAFATRTQDESPYFTFSLPGDPEFALRFVQRLRVDLSRIRKKIKERKMRMKYFKMVFVKTDYDAVQDRTVVTLQKVFADDKTMATIDAAFEPLIAGKRLEK